MVYIKILCKLQNGKDGQDGRCGKKAGADQISSTGAELKPDEGKNREDILYGTGKNSEMLYGDDGLELAEYDRIRQQGHKGPMFGLRLAISLILFACVIYLDKNQIDWKGQSAVAVINRQLETSVIGNSTVEALH